MLGPASIALVAVAAVLAARALAHRAILAGLRAPRLAHAQGPADVGLGSGTVRAARIPGPGGRSLFGWLCMPSEVSAGTVPAVLAMHGWGANAATLWPVVPPLHAAGFAVLLLDARCHGRSDDERFTSMPRFAEDIAAGLEWLRAQPGIAPDRIALLGHSVGAGAALLHASRRHDVRAVVSLSAFTHPESMMRRFLADHRIPYPVVGWYVMRHVQRVIGTSFDRIAPVGTIARVRCPVLLVHGRDDTTVPFDEARRLQAAGADAALLPVAGGHDLRDALAPHAAVLVAFLQAACAAGCDNEAGPRAPPTP
jgi:dipeptidyl aminopeptidase/acylaminoacyl peptidase